jgi:glycerol transport system ATP-binding protein
VGHFIGSPGMNVLPAWVEGRTAFVEGQAIALEHAYPALPQGQRIELGIRPEFVASPPAVRACRCRCVGSMTSVRARIARVEMAGRPLAASVPEALDLIGEEASLVLDPHHIHIYADGHIVAGEAAR